MSRTASVVSSLAAVVCAVSLLAASGQPAQSATLLFSGATLITAETNGRGGGQISNVILAVRDGRIDSVEVATVTPTAGRGRVDLTGKFIIPGLISAHAHVSDINGLKPRAYTTANTLRQLGVFARYGVTTAGNRVAR